ncbi:MAG: SdpI family protein [Syntrophobacteraceae bacterium]
MIVPIPYVHYGIGLLTALLSIPLILRKIPMNHLYGIRIQKAFVSQRNWYEINAYGGKLLLVFGFFLLACGRVGQDFAPPPTSFWAPVFIVFPLLGIVPVLALIKAFSRQLPDQQRG